MPKYSYLDPTIELEFTERMLNDIKELIANKREGVKSDFSSWERKNRKLKNENTEWYQWQEDSFVDEMFFVSELEKNLLNGLAISINTIFERHVSIIIRESKKISDKKDYNDRHTYKIEELKKTLIEINHPNIKIIDSKLISRLRCYIDVRNILVHREGSVSESDRIIKAFIKTNRNLFVIKETPFGISVTDGYIKKALDDIKNFFRLLLYENGEVIYY